MRKIIYLKSIAVQTDKRRGCSNGGTKVEGIAYEG